MNKFKNGVYDEVSWYMIFTVDVVLVIENTNLWEGQLESWKNIFKK